MSDTITRILNDVCLDERIQDGVFRLENESHMNVLRDYLEKHGIPNNEVIKINNKILEGRFPERQAYNANGILCTFPTPQYKQRAISKGTHFEKNPNPQSPAREEPQKTTPPGSKPEPGEKPSNSSLKKSSSTEPTVNVDDTDEEPSKSTKSNLFTNNGPKVSQGGKELEVEPPNGSEIPSPMTTTSQIPKTPEKIAAEKEIVTQILKSDDIALTNISDPLDPTNSALLNKQLNELYKKADELGFREAITFLTPYVKL